MQAGLPEEKPELDLGREPLFVAQIFEPSSCIFSLWALNLYVPVSICNLKLKKQAQLMISLSLCIPTQRCVRFWWTKITEGKMRQNSRLVKSARGADQECALTFAL